MSALHALKPSLAAKSGIPLKIWGRGVTVLLEKICGKNYVHTLRAICLFEADFSWWNNLVFSKRMMKNAADKDLILHEIFSKKGSHAVNAIMCKTFFCDISNVLHWPAGLGGCDFLGDCYDRGAHPPVSIALQAWGISIESTKVLIIALQTMQFCPRTGFGESKTSMEGH